MVDVITLIMMILVTILFIVSNIYIIAYFSHPDDKGSCVGWVLKLIVLLGLTLAWCQVLMLPLDVQNNRTYGSGLNMQILWYIIFISIMAYVLILFPISSSYYEADEDWSCCEKFRHSICWFLLWLFFFGVLTTVLYISIGRVELPIQSIVCTVSNQNFNSSIEIDDNFNITICDIKDNQSLEINVNFIVYAIAVLLFISWMVFSVFGGIGLAAVPLDFYHSFCTRPKSMKVKNLKKRRRELLQELEEIKVLGKVVSDLEQRGAPRRCFLSSERRKYDRKEHEFIARFTLAEEEYHLVNASREARIKNNCVIICYYMLLPFALITTILSLIWVVQFCLSYFYTLYGRPGYPFIAYILIFFQDKEITFLSFFIFAILCLYLLFCMIKGNFKFGVRFLCCWTIHPMKKDKTYMNSFIFNVTLILLGSVAITQFCSDCLSDYVAFTDIDSLFNVLVKNLVFFKYVYGYHIFQYIFFGMFVLSFLVLICRPSDRTKPTEGKKITDSKEMKLLNKKKKYYDD